MITICMPFYNASKTIRQTIHSILNQTYQNFKVILIDDGSTDDSSEIIKDLIDNRFLLIKNRVNQGLIFSLNHIVSLCDTKYIARMDADDIMHPRRIEIQLNFLESNPTVDVVDTLMIAFDDSYQITGLVKFNFLESVEKIDTIISTPLSHATIMAKASWYKKNSYDSDFYRAEDHELFCRTFDSSNFARIYQPLYFVRSHNININNYKSALKTQMRILVRNKHLLTLNQYLKISLRNKSKLFLYLVFGYFNMQHILVSKRNIKLSSKWIQTYSDILRSIK